jgi:hypothetical protein
MTLSDLAQLYQQNTARVRHKFAKIRKIDLKSINSKLKGELNVTQQFSPIIRERRVLHLSCVCVVSQRLANIICGNAVIYKLSKNSYQNIEKMKTEPPTTCH